MFDFLGEDKSLKDVGYKDVGGCAKQLAPIRELVELPLTCPQVFDAVGIRRPKGVLMHGPPGTGKSLLARAVANEAGAKFFLINGSTIMAKHSSDRRYNLSSIFDQAKLASPSIIFMDEIDTMAPSRDDSIYESTKEMVTLILNLIDGIKAESKIVVIAATNKPNSVDPALRIFGRFNKELRIGVPDSAGRLECLQIHTRKMKLDDNVKLETIAQEIHGYVGADVASLCSEAAMQQIREKMHLFDVKKGFISQQVLDSLQVTMENFRTALANSSPSSLRETEVESVNTTWDDIGGLDKTKEELQEIVEYPVLHPELFAKFGLSPSKGVLFYGPPGTGKTLLAKAVATECSANFISVKGPELLSMWYGKSESNIRDIFQKARSAAPTVVFFDELDSIAKNRGFTKSGTRTSDRVVNQLLTEMDGMNAKQNVFIIAATNRPDQIDPAMLRPGRLDQLVYVPLPDEKARLSILSAQLRKSPLEPGLSLEEIAKATHGFSGADLLYIGQKAAKYAIKDCINAQEKAMAAKTAPKKKKRSRRKNLTSKEKLKPVEDPVPYIFKRHFVESMKTAKRSVSDEELRRFKMYEAQIQEGQSSSFKLPENDF